MTPEERARSVKLYACWSSDEGDLRTWDDVRADIAAQIHAAVVAEREACARLATEAAGAYLYSVARDVARRIRARGAVHAGVCVTDAAAKRISEDGP